MMNRKLYAWILGLAAIAVVAAACAAPAAPPTPTVAATVAPPVQPSNPGGPGPAIKLTGDARAGADVFVANCQKCHGPQGQGGVSNPGSSDGTVPPLNPIDSTLVSSDPVVFATNVDLFIEHGSTPAGDKPTQVMPAWGDDKKLTDQQIADVIVNVISINKP